MIHSRDRLSKNTILTYETLRYGGFKIVKSFLCVFVTLLLISTGCSKPIPSDDVSDNTVDVPAWSEPLPITGKAEINSYKISMDKNGSAIMAYSKWDDSNNVYRIFTKNYEPNSGWGDDVPADKGVENGNSYFPFVAWDISGSGSAFSVFVQGNGTNDRVYARMYRKGSGWAENVDAIDPEGAGVPASPQAAFDSSGNAMAVYTKGGKLYANRFDYASSVWGGAKVISAETQGVVNSPKICFLGNGQFMVVFYQIKKSGTMQLFSILFNGTSWGLVPEQIDSDNHNYIDAVMGTDGFGNLMVAFSEGAGNKLYVRRYLNGWKEAKELGIASGKPVRIAYNIDHNAVVLFVQDINGASHVYSSAYTYGTDTWSEPVIIDGADIGSADNPQIYFDGLNRAIAIYTKLIDEVSYLYSTGLEWNTGWKSPERIAGNGVMQVSQPEIVIDWKGNAIILFSVMDIETSQIYAVKYSTPVQY